MSLTYTRHPRRAETIRAAVEDQPGIFCRLSEYRRIKDHTHITHSPGNVEYVPAVWDDVTPEAGSQASYSAIQPCAPDLATHFVPGYLAGSDYSGSSVEASNYKVFLEMFGSYVVDLYGGHGTYAIAVPLVWPDEACAHCTGVEKLYDCTECGHLHVLPNAFHIACPIEGCPCPHTCDECGGTGRVKSDVELEAIGVLASLTGYPVIDEEAMSEVEAEWANDDWFSWAEREWRGELSKLFNDDEWNDVIEPAIDECDPTSWRGFFETMRERANVYWESENSGMHVDIARIVRGYDHIPGRPGAMTADDVRAFLFTPPADSSQLSLPEA